jgi:hypothetical protein
MHGNASCRAEGASYASEFLKRGITLFVFDFIGCGQSDGEFITLGIIIFHYFVVKTHLINSRT